MALVPISPGQSPQFELTFEPAGVPTSIDQIGWAVTSDDGNGNITMSSNPDNPTGSTATLTIPPEISIGAIITYWAVYRNSDLSEILLGPWNSTVVAN